MDMSETENPVPRPYRYEFWKGSRSPSQSEEVREADMETLLLIRDSLKEMTGGCEICRHSEGLICTVHWRSVKADDPRCDSFVRRTNYESGEDTAKKVIQQYVNGILGIRDVKSVKRLTG
jgi:hypothetical protein